MLLLSNQTFFGKVNYTDWFTYFQCEVCFDDESFLMKTSVEVWRLGAKFVFEKVFWKLNQVVGE